MEDSLAQLTTKPTWRTTPYYTGLLWNTGSLSMKVKSFYLAPHNSTTVQYDALDVKLRRPQLVI